MGSPLVVVRCCFHPLSSIHLLIPTVMTHRKAHNYAMSLCSLIRSNNSTWALNPVIRITALICRSPCSVRCIFFIFAKLSFQRRASIVTVAMAYTPSIALVPSPLSAEQVVAYLERIQYPRDGYSGKFPDPSIETLDTIIKQHLLHVPFEVSVPALRDHIQHYSRPR
jgi:hypothetical protein